MKKKAPAIIFTAVFIAAAIALCTVAVAAWFRRTIDSPSDVGGGTFQVRTSAWFDDGAGNLTQLNVKELIEVDVRNPAAANYVGKLRVKATVTSDIVFALRLSVVNLWFQDDTVPRLNAVPFVADSGVIDNSRRDSHYYRCDLAAYDGAAYAAGDFSAFYQQPCRDKDFDFILGVDESKMADYESNVQLKLRLMSEIVQANRIDKLWLTLPPPA